MIIGLDFDKTYTLDPKLWNIFISAAHKRGHKIICVTMRYEHEGEEVKNMLGDLVNEIIFTKRKAKSPYVENRGVKIDIWINDMPYWIIMDSK